MAELLMQLSTGEGLLRTVLEDVRILRADMHHQREPVFFEPSIVILANGRKKFYLGARSITYDPNNYFVLSVPLHFECETFVDEDGPMLGLSIRINMLTLSELAMLMDPLNKNAVEEAKATANAIPLELELSNAAVHLLEVIRSPKEAAILGPGLIREIVYRVLCGPQGPLLMGVLARNGYLAGVLSVIQRIHAHYADNLDVTKMAEEVGMSPSAFHQRFKAVAMTSPLQYLKSVRLQKSRMLMVHDRLSASIAASKVGYESASQFSREFKRYFGKTPLEEVSRLRVMLGLDDPNELPIAPSPTAVSAELSSLLAEVPDSSTEEQEQLA